jgi:CO/xanthine dehydrogenase FAD-binding subunit
MDLIAVEQVRIARDRADLTPDARPLAGGTWLYSEPQPDAVLLDLLGFGWEPVVRTATHLSIAATCTIATLRELPDSPLFQPLADALLASWKVQRRATVGGNIALALPAGPMTALAVGLDATIVLWTADAVREVPAADFVTGVVSTVLRPGEVVRSIEFSLEALAQPAAYRRISLSAMGRTGTLVTGRRTTGGVVLGITGGTERPHVVTVAEALEATGPHGELPSRASGTGYLDAIDDWYDDPHGSPDWREAMTRRFAAELVAELS